VEGRTKSARHLRSCAAPTMDHPMDSALNLAFFLLWQFFLLIVLYMVGRWYLEGLRDRIGVGEWPGSLGSWSGQLAAWVTIIGAIWLVAF